VFDDVFLTAEIVAEWGRNGWQPLLDDVELACGRQIKFLSADTLPAARQCGAVNKRLGTLLQWATGSELTERDAHTALGDASAVFQITPFLGEWLKCREFVVEAIDGLLRRCRNKLKKEPWFKSKVLASATAPTLPSSICATLTPVVATPKVPSTRVRSHTIPFGSNSKCSACGVIYSRHFPRHQCANLGAFPS
jgi:hypothetical protein